MWKKLTRNLDELSKPEMDMLSKTFHRVDINEDGSSSQPSVLFSSLVSVVPEKNI